MAEVNVDMCACGHTRDQHGRESKYYGSTGCRIEGCPCTAFEARRVMTVKVDNALLDEIGRLAEAATPGSWRSSRGDAVCVGRDGDWVAQMIGSGSMWAPNSKHIARLDPPTALALVEEIKRLCEALARANEAIAAAKELTAELRMLRYDPD